MAGKSTILIVDREKILVDLLVRVWSSREIAVLGSTSTEEATRLIDVRAPDLLIIDPSMMNGFPLIASAKSAMPGRGKVIALTSSPDVRSRATAAGVDRVVDRIRGLDALADAVQKLLEKQLVFLEPTGVHILVVEDDETILNLLQDFLLDRGYVVSSARNATDAIKAVCAKSEIQVVLLDILLPDRTGLDILGDIIGAESHPAVIMMAAVLNRDLARDALKRGAADYVLKPFDFAALEASIRSCSRQKQPWWQRLSSGRTP